MAEEKSEKEERKIKFNAGWHKALLEDRQYKEKYGLTKEELDEEVLKCLKFDSSFHVISNYLRDASIWIEHQETTECLRLIERAKYVLKGCKE